MMTRAFCILTVLALCAVSRGAQLVGDGLRTIAFTGQAATGTTGVFSDFGRVAINKSGQIAFRGSLSSQNGVTSTTNTGIWVETTPGQLTLVAREGSATPGSPSGTFGDFINDGPVINNKGEVAFENQFATAGVPITYGNSNGVWSQAGGGTLKLVARADVAAPGTSGNFLNVGEPALNDAGAVTFRGSLPTNPPGFGISIPGMWRTNSSGQVTLVALKGDNTPGVNNSFGSLFYEPVLSASGHVAFKAAYNYEGYDLWRVSPNGTLARAFASNTLPGTSNYFGSYSEPSINNLGKITVAATLYGPGTSTANDRIILSENADGQVHVVARENDIAPGTGGRFDDFTFYSRMNDSGATAFVAALRDSGFGPLAPKGVWLANSEGLKLVAGPGQLAPGTDQIFQVINGICLNNNG
jgi:hypothetical protein